MKISKYFLAITVIGVFFLSGAKPVFSQGLFQQQEYESLFTVFDDSTFEYETGPLYIFQNDGRYGEDGTEYSADDVGQQRNLVLSRRASMEIGFLQRHRLIFLYAPFDVSTVVNLDKDITFRGTQFSRGTLVNHRYLFDGYRVSYIYRVMPGDKTNADLGGSVQIRNAEVSFKEVGGDKYESENDIGVVFALKGRLRYEPCNSGMWLQLEGDGFSTFGLLSDTVEGAIYDLRVSVGLPVSSSTELVFGGRLLGGGADVKNKNIDNWGNYGSLTMGLRVDLARLLGS